MASNVQDSGMNNNTKNKHGVQSLAIDCRAGNYPELLWSGLVLLRLTAIPKVFQQRKPDHTVPKHSIQYETKITYVYYI